MAVDNNGDNHQPAGRPDGGQYAPKAGQGTDDDLATPSEVALLDAAAMLTGRREQARRDADATTATTPGIQAKGAISATNTRTPSSTPPATPTTSPRARPSPTWPSTTRRSPNTWRTWTPTPAPTTSAPPPPTPPRARATPGRAR